MPRDPDRIPRILTLIEEAWKQMPDQRLCQLLSNASDSHGDMYHYEDDRLEDDLKEWIETSKNWTPR